MHILKILWKHGPQSLFNGLDQRILNGSNLSFSGTCNTNFYLLMALFVVHTIPAHLSLFHLHSNSSLANKHMTYPVQAIRATCNSAQVNVLVLSEPSKVPSFEW